MFEVSVSCPTQASNPFKVLQWSIRPIFKRTEKIRRTRRLELWGTRTCAKDDPSDALARLACQLYGLGLEDTFASASSEKDTFLNVNGLVRRILCSGVLSTGGGMTRMCENGPVLAVEFKGAVLGIPDRALFARLALRDVWPWVGQGRQRYFFGRDARFDISQEKLQRGPGTHDEIVYHADIHPAEDSCEALSSEQLSCWSALLDEELELRFSHPTS